MRLPDHTRTVRDGHDAPATLFGAWMDAIEGDPWQRFVGGLAS